MSAVEQHNTGRYEKIEAQVKLAIALLVLLCMSQFVGSTEQDHEFGNHDQNLLCLDAGNADPEITAQWLQFGLLPAIEHINALAPQAPAPYMLAPLHSVDPHDCLVTITIVDTELKIWALCGVFALACYRPATDQVILGMSLDEYTQVQHMDPTDPSVCIPWDALTLHELAHAAQRPHDQDSPLMNPTGCKEIDTDELQEIFWPLLAKEGPYVFLRFFIPGYRIG